MPFHAISIESKQMMNFASELSRFQIFFFKDKMEDM